MKISFSRIVFALVFAILPFLPSVVSAGTEHNISGWGWSSNIGWISFNSTSHGSAVNYGVNNDAGILTGYAWSSNIGWIKFGGLAGFPAAGGNAQLSGNSLIGWARACSVFHSNCAGDYYHGSGPVNNNISTNPYLGGWDGWISLSGSSPTYGVTMTNTGSTAPSQYNCLTDCVWGSIDLGWIDFSGVVVGATNYTVTSSAGSNGSISPSTRTVSSGNTTNFTVTPNSGYSASIGGTCPSGNLVGTTYTTGQITSNCTVVASFSAAMIPGVCSSPADHLNPCSTPGTPVINSSPSKWTWICPGTPPSPQCSENKSPIFIED